MKIRAADGARADFDDGVARVLDGGVRDVGIAADVVLAVPAKGSHWEKSPGSVFENAAVVVLPD
jgi:hypothetical protein